MAHSPQSDPSASDPLARRARLLTLAAVAGAALAAILLLAAVVLALQAPAPAPAGSTPADASRAATRIRPQARPGGAPATAPARRGGGADWALRLGALAVALGGAAGLALLLRPAPPLATDADGGADADLAAGPADGTADPPLTAAAAGGVLGGVAIFAGAEPETLAALAGQAQPRRYLAGEPLCRQGDFTDDVLVIARGVVEVRAANRRQREVQLATLGPGACVGEIAALLPNHPRSATVLARATVDALVIPAAALRAATRSDATLAGRFGQRIGQLGTDSFLKMSSPFVNLAPQAVGELAARMQRRAVAAGEMIVRQGAAGNLFYLITAGRFEVLRDDDGAAPKVPRVVIQLGPGDCFGEAALITEQPRNATVRALDHGEVLELSREDFQATVSQYQNARAFFRELFFARYRRSGGAILSVPDPAAALVPGAEGGRAGRVWIGFAAGVGLLALLSGLTLSTGLALPALLTLLLGAALPAVTYVLYMRERALLRDLPILTLLGASALGAVIGVPLAIWLQLQLSVTNALLSALIVALVEEPIKVGAVLWVMRARQFRFAMDGAILGITAAMGFGGLESLGYGYLGLTQPFVSCGTFDGTGCMVQTIWIRFASVLLGHGPWTAIVCATMWRDYGRKGQVFTAAVAATFVLAVVLHTLWDTDPLIFGIPVAIVGILLLRYLIRQGVGHQAAALANLALLPAGTIGDDHAGTITCLNCKAVFPATAVYCVRCGLSVA